MGKGSKPRPVNKLLFDKNWILAFGATCKNCFGYGVVRAVGEKMDSAKTEDCPFCYGLGKVDKGNCLRPLIPRGGGDGFLCGPYKRIDTEGVMGQDYISKKKSAI